MANGPDGPAHGCREGSNHLTTDRDTPLAAVAGDGDSQPIDAPPKPSTRALYTAYAAGLTGNAINMMLKVSVPLWALHLNMSPSLIGVALGAAGVLPFLLSIHGGVLMDRFGTRRVNMVLAMVATIAIALYPVLPFAAALICLQLVTGLTTNMAWMGAQSLIVQVAPGDTAIIGRFSMASRIGNLASPVLTGMAWDFIGPLGTFLMITACSTTAFAAFYLAPAAEVDAAASGGKGSLRDLVPRFSEYVQAFAMLAIPTIAFISVITFVRIAGSSVQSSFYLVYLNQIGISGTVIGILLGLAEGFGIFGAGIAGWIERKLKAHWTLILFHALAVFFVCIAPFLGGIMVLLFIAAMMRGGSQGLSQPVMFAVLSRAVSRAEQGRSIGLRTTVNRLATMVIPVAMGLLAERFGMVWSFGLTGGFILLICVGLVIAALRIEAFQRA